jgi:hypothetical protein
MSNVNSANNSPNCKSDLSGFESATSVTARRRRFVATLTTGAMVVSVLPLLSDVLLFVLLLDIDDVLLLVMTESLVDANAARRVAVLVSR